MNAFSPVTDADLARARSDRAFRQKLLEQSLEALLSRMTRIHGGKPSAGGNARQLREGVEAALRLAELIQNVSRRGRAS